MGKSQKGPYKLGRTKQSSDQPNPGYYAHNLYLANMTPQPPPPPPMTTTVSNAFKKKLVSDGSRT